MDATVYYDEGQEALPVIPLFIPPQEPQPSSTDGNEYAWELALSSICGTLRSYGVNEENLQSPALIAAVIAELLGQMKKEITTLRSENSQMKTHLDQYRGLRSQQIKTDLFKKMQAVDAALNP